MRLMTTVFLVLVAVAPVGRAQGPASQGPAVTDSEIRLVVTAIRDEIYTNGYEPRYLDLQSDSIALYVSPQRKAGEIWVIYKLLPFGEILRAVSPSPDGSLMLLAGNPENGFPPTRSTAMLTLYLKDDSVIRDKAQWKRVWFSIDTRPSVAEKDLARQRQARRYAVLGWK
jgi:hypothetical protein